MRASRRRILVRRAVAVLAAAGATAAIAILFAQDEDRATQPPSTAAAGVPPGVRKLVSRLDTEGKVDQVLALGFEGVDSTSPFLGELRQRQLGAVFVAGSNWIDAAQGAALVGALRDAAEQGGPVPPLIVARQQGGPDRAFADLPPAASAAQIGALDDPDRAERWSSAAARALAGAGFDLNLGPVADVAGIDSPLAGRAFGEDTDRVTRLTVAALVGCRNAGLACAPMHFPGMGAASQDTDIGPATVPQDRRTLFARDLTPFRAAIAAGAPALVLSHALFSALDPVTPASQAPAVATRLLRERVGFAGVAITDDLDTGAVKALGGVGPAAVASLAAGADLLLIESPGAPQAAARSALLRAVRDGELSRARLDEAAGRVLELKRRLRLL
jgi:beta-N-acetylhexosaminidase